MNLLQVLPESLLIRDNIPWALTKGVAVSWVLSVLSTISAVMLRPCAKHPHAMPLPFAMPLPHTGVDLLALCCDGPGL